VTLLDAVTEEPETVPVDVMFEAPVLIAPEVMVDDVVMDPQDILPDVIVAPPVLIAPEVIAPVFNAPDEVIVPVMLILPVPVILFEFRSRAPPSCGVLSFTTSVFGFRDLKTPDAPPPSPVTDMAAPDGISTPFDVEYVTPLYMTLHAESVSFFIA
jgi:hypothetical protein